MILQKQGGVQVVLAVADRQNFLQVNVGVSHDQAHDQIHQAVVRDQSKK